MVRFSAICMSKYVEITMNLAFGYYIGYYHILTMLLRSLCKHLGSRK